MRRLLIVALAACESADDFPSRPSPIEWQIMARSSRTDSLDGTGYQLSIPGGAQPQVYGSEAVYQVGSLTVQIALYPEAATLDSVVVGNSFESSSVDNIQVRDDGFSFTYNGGYFRYLYVDDGALSCKAKAGVGRERIEQLVEICESLVATTPLANPIQYPKGLSPRELRAGMCSIAVDGFDVLEDSEKPPPKKRRKNKQELAAEKKREEEREARRAARREKCVKQRWSQDTIQCIVRITATADLDICGVSW